MAGRYWRLIRVRVSIRRGGDFDRASAVALFRRGGRGAALREGGGAFAYVAVAVVAGDPRAGARARGGVVRADDSACGVDAGRVVVARAGAEGVGRDRRSGRGRAAFDPVGRGVLRLGYGPFSGAAASRIVEVLRAERPELGVRLVQEVTPDSLRRVGAHELAAAVVMESPAAARRYGVRVDALRDEPLLAALPESHRYASEPAIPIGEFVAEPVLLPREPAGLMFNAWLRSVIARARVRTRADDGDRQRALGSALAARSRTARRWR